MRSVLFLIVLACLLIEYFPSESFVGFILLVFFVIIKVGLALAKRLNNAITGPKDK